MNRNREEKQNRFDREAQKHQRKKNVHPSKNNNEDEQYYRVNGPIDAGDILEDFEDLDE
jgi:hypothetical protein